MTRTYEIRHVLVIDDDHTIRSTVADILEMEGYSVEQAHHGRDALDKIERRPPDLIITDMKMPVMDGWEFVRTYRGRPGASAPVVCMTAAQDASRWCREIQADGCLSKPFDITELLDCVAEPAHSHSVRAA